MEASTINRRRPETMRNALGPRHTWSRATLCQYRTSHKVTVSRYRTSHSVTVSRYRTSHSACGADTLIHAVFLSRISENVSRTGRSYLPCATYLGSAR
eukprot:2724634-Rhodomonas_salina.2